MQKKSRDEEMLTDIYKDCKMGAESIVRLIPDVTDQELKNLLSNQLDSYQNFASQAAGILSKQGKVPPENTVFEKLPAEMGMAMSKLVDKSDGKTAQLMINGYVMGVTELKKQLADVNGVSEETAKLAADLLQFQLQAICDMKRFL